MLSLKYSYELCPKKIHILSLSLRINHSLIRTTFFQTIMGDPRHLSLSFLSCSLFFIFIFLLNTYAITPQHAFYQFLIHIFLFILILFIYLFVYLYLLVLEQTHFTDAVVFSLVESREYVYINDQIYICKESSVA